MNWYPFPASLNVAQNAFYSCFKRNSHYDYQITVEIEIKPWITINVRDFYLELNTGTHLIKAQPMAQIEDGLSGKIFRIGYGYTLHPDEPILKRISFQYESKDEIKCMPEKGTIVMEIGMRKGKWAIHKKVKLYPERT